MAQDELLCSAIEDNAELWLCEKSLVKHEELLPEFPCEFPYDWHLGSVRSETENEVVDDYIADLAQRIAHSMLEDDDEKDCSKDWTAQKSDPWLEKDLHNSVTSPVSETWSLSSWTTHTSTSSNGSSQMSSPPSSPQSADDAAWDMATEELKQGFRMGGHQQSIWSQYDLPLLPLRESEFQTTFSALPSLQWDKPASSAQYFQGAPNREEEYKVSRTQPRLAKQNSASHLGRQSRHLIQQQNGGSRSFKGPPSSQWPQTQSAAGSGLRAVFLGPNLSNRESAGTGVFLPRVGNGMDTKKKPACATVLLPPHIIQALNLNLDDIQPPVTHAKSSYATVARRGLPSQLSAPSSNLQYASRENKVNSVPVWKSLYPTCSPLQQVAPDITLPTEWTY